MGSIALVPGLELWMEIVVAIVCSVFASLASACGVGGGIVFVSMLQLFGVSPHIAAPLSKAMIFLGSFTLMCMNIFQHEDGNPENPIIIWDLVFVIEPAAVAGALIGAIINVTLPEWLLLIFELILLLYVLQKMIRSSFAILNTERIAAGKRPLFTKHSKRCDLSISTSTSNTKEEKEEEEAPLIVLNESHHETDEVKKSRKCSCSSFGTSHFKSISVSRLLNFLITTALVLACEVISHKLTRCSTGYWIVLSICFIVSAIAIIINTLLIKASIRKYQRYLIVSADTNSFLQTKSESMTTETQEITSAADNLDNLDDKQTNSALHEQAMRYAKLLIGSDSFQAFQDIKFYVKFTVIGLLAGIIGALFGIGGGLLKNPILISFGINPERARTASSVMIAFTSLSSMVTYISIGSLNFEYAWPLMLSAGAFFVGGYYLSNPLIRILKTKSLIPFLITALIGISMCFIIANTAILFDDIVKTGKLPGFNRLCDD